MVDTEKQLRDMIEEARKTNKVIFCPHDDRWWTPTEFEQLINDKLCLWSRINFKLCDPDERAIELWEEIRKAINRYKSWCVRNNI